MKYAEIMNGKVRYIGEATALPFFTGSIEAVEIPDGIDDVQEGDIYEKGIFRPQTKEEIIAEYQPVFNAERTRRFSETQWIRQRHADRIELGIDDKTEWKDWLTYWQALRDMPQQPEFDPRTPAWPEAPK